MSKDYVMQLEATIQNLRIDNALLKDELSKYKAIDNANPSEALECLDRLKNIALSDLDSIPAAAIPICEKYNNEVMESYETLEQALLNAEKEHKALEIIKEKEVNMQVFNQCEDVETYNKVYIKQKDRQLTQEEFKLLKEVLE